MSQELQWTAGSLLCCRVLAPLRREEEELVAVVYGTTELRPASDYESFTRELDALLQAEQGVCSFGQLVG